MLVKYIAAKITSVCQYTDHQYLTQLSGNTVWLVALDTGSVRYASHKLEISKM